MCIYYWKIKNVNERVICDVKRKIQVKNET